MFAQQPKVLVLGDSLSAGYGLDISDGWVTLLRQRLNGRYSVINASVSGDTSKAALQRLPKLLAQHQPQVVIIELGGNDGLRGMPAPQLAMNLIQAADLSQQSGADVLLLETPLPPNYGRRYRSALAAAYISASNKCGCPLVKWLDGIPLTEEYLQSDGVHPTSAAQPLMLKQVLAALKPLLDL